VIPFGHRTRDEGSETEKRVERREKTRVKDKPEREKSREKERRFINKTHLCCEIEVPSNSCEIEPPVLDKKEDSKTWKKSDRSFYGANKHGLMWIIVY